MTREDKKTHQDDPMNTNFYNNKQDTYSYKISRKNKEYLNSYFSLPVLEKFINKLKQPKFSLKTIQRWFSQKEKPTQVLDLGSGEGFESAAMRSKLPNSKITSIDISTTGSKLGQNKLDLNQVQGNINDPPFASNTFAGIHCKDVLVHIPNKKEFIRKIAKILKPEGLFILISAKVAYTEINQSAWDPEDIIKIAQQNGLRVIDSYTGKLEVDDWYHGTNPERVFLLFQKQTEEAKENTP